MAADLQILIETMTSQINAFVTTPATPDEGGARLKRISQPTPLPNGEDLGLVIASPNILRPYHKGFNPSSGDRCRFEGDFMDRLIYVTNEDFKDQPDLVKAIAAIVSLFGRLADPEVSTGCSPSSCLTPVYRMYFVKDGQGNVTGLKFADPVLYTVVAAKFIGDNGMKCNEYWVATHEDRDLILNTQEYADARKRSQANCPSDALRRRQQTLEQIARLRNSDLSQVFQTSGC